MAAVRILRFTDQALGNRQLVELHRLFGDDVKIIEAGRIVDLTPAWELVREQQPDVIDVTQNPRLRAVAEDFEKPIIQARPFGRVERFTHYERITRWIVEEEKIEEVPQEFFDAVRQKSA